MNRNGPLIIAALGILCTAAVAIAVVVTPGNPAPFAPLAIFAATFVFYCALAGAIKRHDDQNPK